jgi:hypothetical protein
MEEGDVAPCEDGKRQRDGDQPDTNTKDETDTRS